MTALVASNGPRLSVRDGKMVDRALQVAKASTVRHKHGAVLYKSGRVLGVAVNSQRNEHPTMEIEKDNYTYHAEVAVLRAVSMINSIEGATIYVARVNRQGKQVNSMPCSDCLRSLVAAGIKRIVYTTNLH